MTVLGRSSAEVSAKVAYIVIVGMSLKVSVRQRVDSASASSGLMRCSALALLGCLLAFIGLVTRAMVLYPGGNWLDPSAAGHAFFANFLCDLTQPVSLSGVKNREGALCAQVGMLFFSAALAVFFWLLPGHFVRRTVATPWTRALGACAALSLAAVALTPSERFGHWHALLALVSAAFGSSGALYAAIELRRSRGLARALGGLGCLTLVLGALDAVLFVYHWGELAAPPLIVPAAQKLAALLLCAWMLGVAWLTLSGERKFNRPR
jgi:hypothetical protein